MVKASKKQRKIPCSVAGGTGDGFVGLDIFGIDTLIPFIENLDIVE